MTSGSKSRRKSPSTSRRRGDEDGGRSGLLSRTGRHGDVPASARPGRAGRIASTDAPFLAGLRRSRAIAISSIVETRPASESVTIDAGGVPGHARIPTRSMRGDPVAEPTDDRSGIAEAPAGAGLRLRRRPGPGDDRALPRLLPDLHRRRPLVPSRRALDRLVRRVPRRDDVADRRADRRRLVAADRPSITRGCSSTGSTTATSTTWASSS